MIPAGPIHWLSVAQKELGPILVTTVDPKGTTLRG